MPQTSEFDHLAATWADHPAGTAGAAVAESYRKQGHLEQAAAVAAQCVERWPEFLPGHLVLARIRRDAGEVEGAGRALLAALATDPAHPLVLTELARLAELKGDAADGRAWQQLGAAASAPALPGLPGFLAGPALQPTDPDAEPDFLGEELGLFDDLAEPGEEVLTESLAALYQAQGHLERAAEVYAVLAERTPDNPTLAGRRDALYEDLASNRPRPYDARMSGGIAVGAWLRGVASARPRNSRTAENGYDAFFRTPLTREPPEDFEAFQNWLKGLGR